MTPAEAQRALDIAREAYRVAAEEAQRTWDALLEVERAHLEAAKARASAHGRLLAAQKALEEAERT
jgi:hypothetical protein